MVTITKKHRYMIVQYLHWCWCYFSTCTCLKINMLACLIQDMFSTRILNHLKNLLALKLAKFACYVGLESLDIVLIRSIHMVQIVASYWFSYVNNCYVLTAGTSTILAAIQYQALGNGGTTGCAAVERSCCRSTE